MTSRRRLIKTVACGGSVASLSGCLSSTRNRSSDSQSSETNSDASSITGDDLDLRLFPIGSDVSESTENVSDEHITLKNISDRNLNLERISVKYSDGYEYSFGEFSQVELIVPPEGKVQLYSDGEGNVSKTDFYPPLFTLHAGHPGPPALEKDSVVSIYDAEGNQILKATV